MVIFAFYKGKDKAATGMILDLLYKNCIVQHQAVKEWSMVQGVMSNNSCVKKL